MSTQTPAKFKVTDLEKTYDKAYLDVVASLPPTLDLGRYPDQNDPRDLLYPDHVETQIVQPLGLDPIDEHRIALIPPYEGMADKFSRNSRTGPVIDSLFELNSVIASGIGHVVEHFRRRDRHTYQIEHFDWLRRTKEADPWGNVVQGTELRSALKVAHRQGLNVFSKTVERNGELVPGYLRLTALEQILEAVAKHSTVLLGLQVDRGIFTPLKTDQGPLIPPPDTYPLGGIGALITGFWLSNGWFQVKLPWGPNWGEDGLAWLPITWFHQYPRWDAWIINPKEHQ